MQHQRYLVVLNEAQQHGHHHFLLGVQLLPCIRFIRAPKHKQVMHDGLQSRDCWEMKMRKLYFAI